MNEDILNKIAAIRAQLKKTQELQGRNPGLMPIGDDSDAVIDANVLANRSIGFDYNAPMYPPGRILEWTPESKEATTMNQINPKEAGILTPNKLMAAEDISPQEGSQHYQELAKELGKVRDARLRNHLGYKPEE